MKYRIIEEIDGLGKSEFFAEILIEPDVRRFFGIFWKPKWVSVTRYSDWDIPMKFKSSEDVLHYLKLHYFPKTYKVIIEDEV